jgi:hypothetical protein
MRQSIPTPVFVAVIVVAVLIALFFGWQRARPGAGADKTEEMIQSAFGGGRSAGAGPGATRPVKIPPPPGGPAPTGGGQPEPGSPGVGRPTNIPPPPGGQAMPGR